MATAKRQPPHEPVAPCDPVERRLEALTQARRNWIKEASEAVQRHGFVDAAWLVGSLGSGTADAYSDVDLVVAVNRTTPAEVFADPVAGLGLPGRVLYTRPKPRNAPAGGGYLAVCVQLAGLPVLIDLYLWPSATAAVPSGGSVLFSRTPIPHTDLGFMPLLDQNRTSRTADADADSATATLLLVQLAAKYHARADQPRYAAMAARLHLTHTCGIGELCQTVHARVDGATRADLNDAVIAVNQRLDLVETVTASRSTTP